MKKCDKHITKWLVFHRLHNPNIKTQIWLIISNHYGQQLGYIKWFSRWRCYSFFPERETIFNNGCLKDIKDFIDRLMNDRQ